TTTTRHALPERTSRSVWTGTPRWVSGVSPCVARKRERAIRVDITKTVEPRSDQLNFDDVQTHPLTITVTGVKAGPPDQPVELHNAEFEGRPYKPGKSMRRVLIAAWGTDAS